MKKKDYLKKDNIPNAGRGLSTSRGRRKVTAVAVYIVSGSSVSKGGKGEAVLDLLVTERLRGKTYQPKKRS